MATGTVTYNSGFGDNGFTPNVVPISGARAAVIERLSNINGLNADLVFENSFYKNNNLRSYIRLLFTPEAFEDGINVKKKTQRGEITFQINTRIGLGALPSNALADIVESAFLQGTNFANSQWRIAITQTSRSEGVNSDAFWWLNELVVAYIATQV